MLPLGIQPVYLDGFLRHKDKAISVCVSKDISNICIRATYGIMIMKQYNNFLRKFIAPS